MRAIIQADIRGGHLGAKLGLFLSSTYTLVVALSDLPLHPLAVLVDTLYVAVLGVLPATFLGFITGWCMEVIVKFLKDRLTAGTALLVGGTFCLAVAALLTLASWSPWIRYPLFFHINQLRTFLLFGGIPALIYVIAGSLATKSSFRELQRVRPGNRSTVFSTQKLSDVAPFVVLIVIVSTWNLFGYLSRTTYEFYILPEGYVGPVIVIFDQEGGQRSEHEGGVRVYRIPRSGILYTRFSNTGSYHAKFWYEDDKGQRTEIPVVNSSCKNPELGNTLFACNRSGGAFTRGRTILDNRSYLVGTEAQMDELGGQLRDIIDRALWPLSDD